MTEDREKFEELTAMHLENDLSAEDENALKELLQKYPEWKEDLKSYLQIHSQLENQYFSKKRIHSPNKWKVPMYLASAALIFVGVWISINQFSHSDAGKSTVAYSAESKIAMEDDSSEEVLQTAPIPQKEKEEKKQTGCKFQSQGKNRFYKRKMWFPLPPKSNFFTIQFFYCSSLYHRNRNDSFQKGTNLDSFSRR